MEQMSDHDDLFPVYKAFATDGLMASLLLAQLLLTVSVYFTMSHMQSHTS